MTYINDIWYKWYSEILVKLRSDNSDLVYRVYVHTISVISTRVPPALEDMPLAVENDFSTKKIQREYGDIHKFYMFKVKSGKSMSTILESYDI